MTAPNVQQIKQRLIERGKTDIGALADAFEMIRATEDHESNVVIRKYAADHLVRGGGSKALDLCKRALLFDAQISFDAYLQYTEWNRPFDKKFYVPRRKQLKPIVDAMQELAEHKLELLAVSMPPGTGKSTLALFFITWLAGKHPDQPILTGSHANSFLRGAYDECLRMMDPDGEYLWNDVFLDLHVIKTNAQDMLIDIGADAKQARRFPTLEFSSVGSGNAGKVRAMGLLYADDLVPSLETALSRDRLDKLWMQYTTDLRQRKIGSCPELIIATRWSVSDVIGRLEQKYGGQDTAKFIVCPALDENDQSNFDYPIDAGLTTKFLHDQRDAMDDASWQALYMNQPIEREGQLYSKEELRRYFELPDKEPDAILAVCDTKDRGVDYCVMPIAYQYGQDYYVEAVICNDGKLEAVEPLLIYALCKHKVQMARFESNAAGGTIAKAVQEGVKEKGGRCKITTKFSAPNKETRIIADSPFVKDHFLFKDDSAILNDNEYKRFMRLLTIYTLKGTNKSDDAPDTMSMFANFVQNMALCEVTVMRSPFRAPFGEW